MSTTAPPPSRERLVALLRQASELEHSLCCQYLYTIFSLRRLRSDYPGRLAQDPQVELMMTATQRWAADLFAVAREEMEHLAIATNLLTAVGERPHFEHGDFPDPTVASVLGNPAALERLNGTTLRRYQHVERPNWGGTVASRPPVTAIYLEINSLFQSLPAATLFRGDGLRQVTPNDVELGISMTILPVTSRATASAAINLILQQGEGLGAMPTDQTTHYERFTRTLTDYRQLRASSKSKVAPSLPVVTNPVSRPGPDGQVPDGATLVTNPFSAAVMDLFNEGYRLMLIMLQEFMWGFRGYSGPIEAVEALATPAQLASDRLVTILSENALFPFMTMFIRPLGELLARQPAFVDTRDPARAGAAFQTGGAIPIWRDVHLYANGLGQLAAHAQRLSQEAPTAEVRDSLTYLTQNLSRMRSNVLAVWNHGN